MEFQKISSPSLRELFVNQFEELILSGKLKIGEKLPPERQLAEEMQVSRAVVNSGIRELEKKGFLTVKPRSGTFVADYRQKGTIDTLLAIMNYRGGRLKSSEIRSILEIRIALDTLAVQLCIPSITDEDIALLHEKIRAIKNANDATEAAGAAFAFQHEFALVSGNTLMPLIMQSFRPPVFTLWERFCILYGIPTLYENNYRLWTYIRDRDKEGAIGYIQSSMEDVISGSHQIYFD